MVVPPDKSISMVAIEAENDDRVVVEPLAVIIKIGKVDVSIKKMTAKGKTRLMIPPVITGNKSLLHVSYYVWV